ncbi:uncharacterized protein LOC125061054 isoform X1 [Pieris napi]|uniref:uncharacterized protein LOC125061054 isoform X1 n=1 Tax=Pieris napi TaxID=78633 RepID=UPI001FB961D2|nr:uncharacterized protein LOC125061054 isoform X1 [Pieris napi]
MESPKPETPKLPDMVKLKLRRMCGDHPSVTKTELNVKEAALEDNDKRPSSSFAKLSPTPSRTERSILSSELRARTMSEHALRAMEARRRTGTEAHQRSDADPLHANRALIQAALGSFRWPPYLVCVWVLVLLVSHLLHCLVGILERALPAIYKFCQYFRAWTEDSWRNESDVNGRLYPIGLACVTGLLYVLYCVLYLLYSVTLWAVEPLCTDTEEKPSTFDVPKITNYIDEIHSKTNATIKS